MVGHIKIPKRIGAVKVPKQIRRKAKKAIRAAASPLVRDFAGAAMAAAQRVRREAEDLKDRASDWKEFEMCEGEHFHLKGSKVAEAFRDAAIAGIRTFLEGLDEGLRKAKAEAAAANDDQPEPRAKPARKAKVRVKVKASANPKPKKPRASRSSPGAKPA